ncbi:MAG TPA: DUF4918 family protein [Flavobacteriales bacterium]|nr:DUF4918 family protein [Flavobacteriales bacterium]
MLADRLLQEVFSFDLSKAKLPKRIGVLDPFNGENAQQVRRNVELFHRQFYADNRPRMLMLGINPGRFGAGSTGICFTDTKRCVADLGIPVDGLQTHEPSSDFFYRMVRAAGGPETFYGRVYVQSLCPLGFTQKGKNGTWVNLNYYDDAVLQKKITPLIVDWVNNLIATGMRTDLAACIGTGKNFTFFKKLNDRHRFFDRIIPLAHPRFVMQYKYKQLNSYVDSYLVAVLEAA